MPSLTCENCLHNKYFPPVTFLVRNSPASDPRSECRAGFQDKFHLTPDSEERSKARKRESQRAAVTKQASDLTGHPILWAGVRRWPLSAAPGLWLRLMLIGSPAWFYNFHFYLSPRAKRLRTPQSWDSNGKWNQNHSSDSLKDCTVTREIHFKFACNGWLRFGLYFVHIYIRV